MKSAYTLIHAFLLLIFATLIFLPHTFAQGAVPENMVRLVYFLPNDRSIRPERVEAFMINYTTGVVPDGTVRKSWKASKGRVNLPAPSYGTPGAKHTSPDADIAAAPVNASLASSQTASPDATSLFANYPNPFNPETWIPYQLAKASDVKITIYNAHGVVVKQLELGHQPQGFYTSRSRAAYWDGRNELGERVASGIYFYQLQADNVSSMRKMLILK